MAESSRAQDDKRPKKKRKVNQEDLEKWHCTPWLSYLPSGSGFATFEEKLHHEILAFSAYCESTPQETALRQAVVNWIERVIRQRLPDARAEVFGSSVTGLTVPVADIDISISSRSLHEFSDKKRILFQLDSLIRRDGARSGIISRTQVNHFARVPILIIHTGEQWGSLSIDVGLHNPDGPSGATLMRSYVDKTKPGVLVPLIRVVKAFLLQRGLGSAANSGMGSYVTCLVCMSYLQIHGEGDGNLGSLLINFLRHYALEFPYATDYISVSEGRLVSKHNADWIADSRAEGEEKLVVQDIVRRGNDVAKSLGKIVAVRNAMKEACARLLQRSGPLGPDRQSGGSCLETVVRVHEDTIRQRERIRQTVDSGMLTELEPRQFSSNSHNANRPAPQDRRRPPYTRINSASGPAAGSSASLPSTSSWPGEREYPYRNGDGTQTDREEQRNKSLLSRMEVYKDYEFRTLGPSRRRR